MATHSTTIPVLDGYCADTTCAPGNPCDACAAGPSDDAEETPCGRCTDTDRPLNDDGLCAQCVGEVEMAMWDDGPVSYAEDR